MVLILPDSSVLIPYLIQRVYAEPVERQLRLKRLILCSVVAEEIMAGARDQTERRRYNRFFALFQTARLSATPTDGAWHTAGTSTRATADSIAPSSRAITRTMC